MSSFVVLPFKSGQLELELVDPGLELVRLSAWPTGHWDEPPEHKRNLRVDPPVGFKGRYSVLYTGSNALVVAQECEVIAAQSEAKWLLNLTQESKTKIGRYTTTKAGVFIRLDGRNWDYLLETESPDGLYDATQQVGLALHERFREVAHGISWRSFHRHQAGRVYAIWHERKTDLGIVAPVPSPLSTDPDWRARIDGLKAQGRLLEIS